MNPKQLAAAEAVTLIKNGMTVGLGTGSTAAFAIEAVSKRVQEGLSITAVASSRKSEEQAIAAGITIVPFAKVKAIDIYIDGADEVDTNCNLLKGGGGALLREKILAFHSKKFIVIVDESKLVDCLGAFPLPVEVTPFALELTIRQLALMGAVPALRLHDGHEFITDNGNRIVDCAFPPITDPVELGEALKRIPGVVEHGLFAKQLVSKVIIGYENGEVLYKKPPPAGRG